MAFFDNHRSVLCEANEKKEDRKNGEKKTTHRVAANSNESVFSLLSLYYSRTFFVICFTQHEHDDIFS